MCKDLYNSALISLEAQGTTTIQINNDSKLHRYDHVKSSIHKILLEMSKNSTFS